MLSLESYKGCELESKWGMGSLDDNAQYLWRLIYGKKQLTLRKLEPDEDSFEEGLLIFQKGGLRLDWTDNLDY